MTDFFPAGFWPGMTIFGTAVCIVFGVDILFGSKFMRFMSRTANQKFHVDQIVVNALQKLKNASDHEFDTESPLTRGWGRFVVSGILLAGAGMMVLTLLPVLK